MQPRFLYGKMLLPVNLLHIRQPKHGSHLPLRDQIVGRTSTEAGQFQASRLRKLPDFFIERHLRYQRRGPLSRFSSVRSHLRVSNFCEGKAESKRENQRHFFSHKGRGLYWN